MTTVVMLVVVTGVIAAAFAALTVSITGFTSAGRATVQARAAAEGGLEYAAANLMMDVVCKDEGSPEAPTVVPSPDDDPRFDVTVSYLDSSGAWTTECPATVTEVRLVSTGYSRGTTTSAGGRSSTMEGRYKVLGEGLARRLFPDVVLGRARLELAGSATLTGDVSTAGELGCNASMTLRGNLHYGGTKTGRGTCVTTGTTYGSATYDPAAPANAFPEIAYDDPRLPRLEEDSLSRVIQLFDPLAPSTACTIGKPNAKAVKLGDVHVDARGCDEFSISASVSIELTGDVIFYVDDFRLDGHLTVSSKTGPYTIYFIRPWQPGQQGCALGLADGVDVGKGGFATDANSKVVLYSSAGAEVRSSFTMTGQIYACDVRIASSTTMRYGTFGWDAPASPGGLQLLSRSDVPDPVG